MDFEAVLETAARCNVALEINASPARLDMDEMHVDMARKTGVLMAIGTDAHRPESLVSLSYGINVARRAWCSAGDIVTAWPLDKVIKWLSA